MGILEIVMLAAGAAVVMLSFLLPDKPGAGDGRAQREQEERLKGLLLQEVQKSRLMIEEKTRETIEASAGKTERAMERMANEKIMAIQEYSDTVLGQIHRDHEEAVFLYDMLNNKHEQIKHTLSEISRAAKDAKARKGSGEDCGPGEGVSAPSADTREPLPGKEEAVPLQALTKAAPRKEPPLNRQEATGRKSAGTMDGPAAEAPLPPGQEGAGRKEQVLKLHREGRTEVEIAKALEMGVGEVRLFIGLYEEG